MPLIDLQTRRSVPEIFSAAARLYRAYPLLFFLLAAGVMVPFQLAVLALTGEPPLHRARESIATSWSLTLVRATLISGLISALHIHAVVIAGRGERPRLRTVAPRGLRVLPVVFAAEIVHTVLTFIGTLLLFLPGLLLSLMLAVTAQAAALEGNGWIGALRSSRNLTRDEWVHVFLVLLSTGLIVLAADLLARALPLGSATGATAVAVGLAVDTATSSLAALVIALLYFDLKSRAGVTATASAAA